jgi:hypothetical protein
MALRKRRKGGATFDRRTDACHLECVASPRGAYGRGGVPELALEVVHRLT